MEIFIGILIGALLTFILIGKRVISNYIINRRISNEILEFLNGDKLKFYYRIGNMVYINGYKSYSLRYDVETKKILVLGSESENEYNIPILINNGKTSDAIYSKFEKNILKTYKYKGVLYSENISNIENEDQFNFKKEDLKEDPVSEIDEKIIDEILEQITKKGIDSLSEDQKLLLDKQSSK